MSDIDKILDYLACDGYGTPIGVLESVPAARAELADLRRRAQGVDVEAVVRERDELRKRCEDLVLIANTWALSDEDGNPWGLRVTDNKLVLVDEDGDIVLDRDEHTGLPILNDAARRALARETGAKP